MIVVNATTSLRLDETDLARVDELARLEARLVELRAWPAERRDSSWEQGVSRLEDARRLAAGETTPEALQRENSLFPPGESSYYVDLVGDVARMTDSLQWQETYQRLLQEEA